MCYQVDCDTIQYCINKILCHTVYFVNTSLLYTSLQYNLCAAAVIRFTTSTVQYIGPEETYCTVHCINNLINLLAYYEKLFNVKLYRTNIAGCWSVSCINCVEVDSQEVNTASLQSTVYSLQSTVYNIN